MVSPDAYIGPTSCYTAGASITWPVMSAIRNSEVSIRCDAARHALEKGAHIDEAKDIFLSATWLHG